MQVLILTNLAYQFESQFASFAFCDGSKGLTSQASSPRFELKSQTGCKNIEIGPKSEIEKCTIL